MIRFEDVKPPRLVALKSVAAGTKPERKTKTGRPSIGEPWKAAGVARRTWFRQQAASKS